MFFDIISLFAAELEELKIGISGKGLGDGVLQETTRSCTASSRFKYNTLQLR